MSVSMSGSSDDSSSGSAVTSHRNTWLEVAQLSLELAAQLASSSASSASRKRTKKSNAQVGRKKANEGAAGDEAVTLRTRRAMARETAAKARREAEEAELKAAAAREAAQAAAREEIEATRNELSAIHAQEDVLDMMPLEVHVQETTAARRTLFPKDELQVEFVKKMTPRRKQLAKKVRKT